jgi:hypothetical protein
MSNKQPTTNLSTSESEYKALGDAAKEALHGLALFEELGIHQKLPLAIYEDNTATIAMANNPIISKKSKHIHLAHHFFKEHVQNKTLQILYISTLHQEADLLTKIVATVDIFYTLVQKIFNLPNISIPKRNVTFMIHTIPQNQTATLTDRERDLTIAYNHLNNTRYGYVLSENYERNEVRINSIRNHSINQFEDNIPFKVSELIHLSFITSTYIKSLSKVYQRLFPSIMNLPSDIYSTHVQFSELATYHENMELYIVFIRRLKTVELMFNTPDDKNRLLTKTEISEIINSRNLNNNLTGMVKALSEEETAIKKFLLEDSEYIEAVAKIKTQNKKNKIVQDCLINFEKDKAIDRMKQLNPETSDIEWFKNDEEYQDQMTRINENNNISETNKNLIFNQLKQNSLNRKSASEFNNPPNNNNNNNDSPIKIDYKLTKSDKQVLDNKKRKPDYQAYDNQTSSNKKPSNQSSNKKSSNKSSNKPPPTPTHHLSNSKNRQIIQILRDKYPEFFSTLLSTIPSSFIDDEADEDDEEEQEEEENQYDLDYDSNEEEFTEEEVDEDYNQMEVQRQTKSDLLHEQNSIKRIGALKTKLTKTNNQPLLSDQNKQIKSSKQPVSSNTTTRSSSNK